MLTQYVVRGVKAGIAAGIAFGAFVALVGNPLVGNAETFETAGHGGGPLVSGAVTGVVSVLGGVLYGLLLGAVAFGAVYYFFEPAIPGEGSTKSYLLAAAGFVTVSGAPWLVLPPQPPGVEQALPIGTRLQVYLVMMVAGAAACVLSGYVFDRLRARFGRWVAVLAALGPFGLLFVAATLAPANPVAGPLPAGVGDVFRSVTIAGQVGLWFVLASVHAWLLRRERDGERTAAYRRTADDVAEASGSS